MPDNSRPADPGSAGARPGGPVQLWTAAITPTANLLTAAAGIEVALWATAASPHWSDELHQQIENALTLAGTTAEMMPGTSHAVATVTPLAAVAVVFTGAEPAELGDRARHLLDQGRALRRRPAGDDRSAAPPENLPDLRRWASSVARFLLGTAMASAATGPLAALAPWGDHRLGR